ncbi:hypothetical protein [Phenylobacterium sp.]|nr:hypothetical protein [Phenylobacterium sp.]HVI30727.1 hypothetical protein [Phenylobacterium sp.]
MVFFVVAAGVLAMTAVVYLLMRQPKAPPRTRPDETGPAADDGDGDA